MKDVECTLVISKHKQFSCADISASVTALKMKWEDDSEGFMYEINDRLYELRKWLDDLLSAPNIIRVLDLSELCWFSSSYYHLFRHDNCQLEELYLPESEGPSLDIDIITLKVLSAPGAISIYLHGTPKLTKIVFGKHLRELHLKNVGIPNIKIPSSITSLKIVGCKNIREIIIPDGIRLAAYALSKNENLEKVALPKSLPIIEPYLFEGCKSLRIIKGGKNLKYIFPSAFNGCTSLESIVCPNICKYVTNEPSELEWMKFRSTIRTEKEEESYYSKFISELKKSNISNVSSYITQKYFPLEIDEVVCLGFMHYMHTDDGWIFWSLRKGRYFSLPSGIRNKYTKGDIFKVLVCEKKVFYEDGKINVYHTLPVISLYKKEKLTDEKFWEECGEEENTINSKIQEYKNISSFVSGKILFPQECQDIERNVLSLNINDIVDSYDVKVRTWWQSRPGKDDDEWYEKIVTSKYSDVYLEKFLPQDSEKSYSSGGSRPWLDYGESETKQLQADADERTKSLKANALRKYSQIEHIRTLIVEKAKEQIDIAVEIERKYHINAAIRFLYNVELGEFFHERQERLLSFRLSDVILGASAFK